ncbi:MAG: HEAT repeat domain-containing protein, partial [Planctomycetota bacterium]|nr:HEAT repeat domain-containing protein [Planctomycetota bacterium]
ALLDIGDKRAIEPIDRYIQGPNLKENKAVARRVLVQLKETDPLPALRLLLDSEAYEPEKADLIENLSRYKDSRVVAWLSEIARNSPSAFMRREAIRGLGSVGTRQALLELTQLFKVKFPAELKAEWGWKVVPDFSKFFPEWIQEVLEERTGQRLGRDGTRWAEWISSHYQEDARGKAG